MICADCGKNNTDWAKSCFFCGKALSPQQGGARTQPARAEARMYVDRAPVRVSRERPGIVSVLAALQFIAAFVALLIAVASLAAGLFGGGGNGIVPIAIGAVFGVVGALSVMCGIGLWSLRSYGRTMQLVFSWIGLIGIPIGTVISILTLIYLHKPGIKVLFSERSSDELTPQEAAQVAAVSGSSAVVTVLIVAVAMFGVIMVIGIIAAIAIPSLLRARMVANEASAIGTMRAITSAQVVYFERCNGYAQSLPELGKSGDVLPVELTAATTVTRSGYQIALAPSGTATPAPDANEGCDSPVTDYFANAVPVSPGSTGLRQFATDATATIVHSTVTIGNPIPAGAVPLQ